MVAVPSPMALKMTHRPAFVNGMRDPVRAAAAGKSLTAPRRSRSCHLMVVSAAGALFGLWTWGCIAAADLPVEAPVPAGSTPTGTPGRFHSARTYENTLDFYRRIFNQTGGVKWRHVISQPGIRARHADSLRKRTRWEGINIFDVRGEVKITVIPRDGYVGPDRRKP